MSIRGRTVVSIAPVKEAAIYNHSRIPFEAESKVRFASEMQSTSKPGATHGFYSD